MSLKVSSWVYLLLVVSVLVSMVGCAATPAPTAAPAAPTAAPAATKAPAPRERFDGTKLRISAISDTYANVFRKWGDEIKQKYGIEMEFSQAPTVEVYQRDMLEFASGASTHDIVLFQPAWLADYAPHLADLGDMAKKYNLNFYLDDVLDIFLKSHTTWEGKFLAIPFDADMHNFYYNSIAFEDQRNKDAFKAKFGKDLKVPDTWDEYVQTANFFNARDWNFDGKVEYGVSEAWFRGGFPYWWWLSKFFGYGGIYFDENMNPLINSPAGIKALEAQLAIKDALPPGSFTFQSGEARAAWLNGDVAMVYHWTSTAKLAMDPKVSKIVKYARTTLVPGVKDGDKIYRRPALPTGWTMGIPKYSKNQEAAAKVIEFIANPERSKIIATTVDFWCEPWRKSSFTPELWSKLWPDYPEYGKAVAETMLKTLEIGVPDLQIPGQDEYVKAADAEISAALSINKTPKQALDDAAKEWNNITNRLGKASQQKYWKAQFEALKARGIVYRPELAK